MKKWPCEPTTLVSALSPRCGALKSRSAARFVRCLNLPATFALLLLDNSYHHAEWLTPASFRGTSGNSQHPNRQAAARMYRDFAYSLFISFAGAILFLLVDRLEHNGPVASSLKFLILFVSSVVIMHRLRPYGAIAVLALNKLGERSAMSTWPNTTPSICYLSRALRLI